MCRTIIPQAAYGEQAFHIMPRSYLLPEQYMHWRVWADRQHSAATPHSQPTWVVKTNMHRGKGWGCFETYAAVVRWLL
jgi:hypothetical protein